MSSEVEDWSAEDASSLLVPNLVDPCACFYSKVSRLPSGYHRSRITALAPSRGEKYFCFAVFFFVTSYDWLMEPYSPSPYRIFGVLTCVAGMYGVLSDTMLHSLETPPPPPLSPAHTLFYFEYSLTFFCFPSVVSISCVYGPGTSLRREILYAFLCAYCITHDDIKLCAFGVFLL